MERAFRFGLMWNMSKSIKKSVCSTQTIIAKHNHSHNRASINNVIALTTVPSLSLAPSSSSSSSSRTISICRQQVFRWHYPPLHSTVYSPQCTLYTCRQGTEHLHLSKKRVKLNRLIVSVDCIKIVTFFILHRHCALKRCVIIFLGPIIFLRTEPDSRSQSNRS